MKNKLLICKKFEFCCAHRILGHEGKCKNLHGHNYVLDICFKSLNDSLDELGRVIDFKKIKSRVNKWLNENFDHNVIVYRNDHELLRVFDVFQQEKDPYILNFNPTCENIALHLMNDILNKLFEDENLLVHNVTLFESSGNKVILTSDMN